MIKVGGHQGRLELPLHKKLPLEACSPVGLARAMYVAGAESREMETQNRHKNPSTIIRNVREERLRFSFILVTGRSGNRIKLGMQVSSNHNPR
jgi:hypothetical protein